MSNVDHNLRQFLAVPKALYLNVCEKTLQLLGHRRVRQVRSEATHDDHEEREPCVFRQQQLIADVQKCPCNRQNPELHLLQEGLLLVHFHNALPYNQQQLRRELSRDL